MFDLLTEKRVVDRSDWLSRALKANPAIADLRSRLSPLSRAVAFSEAYNAGRGRSVMPTPVVTQLVMQYLYREGLRSVVQSLEKESGIRYEYKEVDDVRLITLLQMVLRDTDKIWDLTINDKSSQTPPVSSTVASGKEYYSSTGASPSSSANNSPRRSRRSGMWFARSRENTDSPDGSPQLRARRINENESQDNSKLNPASNESNKSERKKRVAETQKSGKVDEEEALNRDKLEEILTAMRLLRENESFDVNIWEEPKDTIRFETPYMDNPSSPGAEGSKLTPRGRPQPNSPRSLLEAHARIPLGSVSAGAPQAVLAGSLNSLVIHLTPAGQVDLNFIQTFLATYHWFTKPETLLVKLIQRYHVPRDKGRLII